MKTVNIIFGIFVKQIKDTLRSKQVLLLFFVFPVIAFAMVTAMNDIAGQANFFIAVFATIHIIFTPIVCSATVVAEEKEKNTLRMLIMSNVKPFQYLFSIGGFIWLMTMLTGGFFFFIGDYTAEEIPVIAVFMAFGTILSVLLGMAAGTASRSVSAANGIAVPLGMVLGFLPMLARFNETIQKAADFLYSQQISYVLEKTGEQDGRMAWILALNLMICLGIFVLVFRKKGLDE